MIRGKRNDGQSRSRGSGNHDAHRAWDLLDDLAGRRFYLCAFFDSSNCFGIKGKNHGDGVLFGGQSVERWLFFSLDDIGVLDVTLRIGMEMYFTVQDSKSVLRLFDFCSLFFYI